MDSDSDSNASDCYSSNCSWSTELNKDLKLNGENYALWSTNIQDLLVDHQVFYSIFSVVPKPEEGTTSHYERDIEAYMLLRKMNSTACTILLSAMENDIAKEFNIYDNAMDMWNALKRKFGGVSLTKLRSMALKFDTYKMRSDHTMKQHLREMSKMINERSEAGQKMTEEQHVHAVIRSLPDRWDHMRMHLMRTESIRTFEDAASHLKLEEDRLSSIRTNVEAHFTGSTSVENNSNRTGNEHSCFNDYGKEPSHELKKVKQNQERNKPSMNKQKVNIARVECSNDNQNGHYVNEIMESSARDRLVSSTIRGMQIFVEDIAGKIITLEVVNSDIVGDLKRRIEATWDIPTSQQRLLFKGKILEDPTCIADYNIGNQSTITYVKLYSNGPVPKKKRC